jgi:hypothetical protein
MNIIVNALQKKILLIISDKDHHIIMSNTTGRDNLEHRDNCARNSLPEPKERYLKL